MSYTIPGGRSKGTPLSEASDADITFWKGKREERLGEDPYHKWADSDREWIAAATSELKRRQGGGGTQPAKARPLTREGLILAAIQGTAAYSSDPYDIAKQAVTIADHVLELTGGQR